MVRIVVAVAIALAGCASTDDRPQTLEYITMSILAPNCGTAACHSTFKQEQGYVFDTVSEARRTIIGKSLVELPDDRAMPEQSRLIQVIEIGFPSVLFPGSGNIRMPYDKPMPNEDVVLMKNWIKAGADGAQCIPEEGDQCAGNNVVACEPNGNLGIVPKETCATTCQNGVCL